MKRRSRKYQVGGGIGQGQPNPMQPNQGGFNQGGFNQMQPMMNPVANAQANQMYMNSITNQAQNLVNQGMFKDTRRGNRRAMKAAMRQANPGQGARNFANIMGGFGSVLSSVAPIMGGAASIMDAKTRRAYGMPSMPNMAGQFQEGGSLPEYINSAIEAAKRRYEMDPTYLPDFIGLPPELEEIRQRRLRNAEMLAKQGLKPIKILIIYRQLEEMQDKWH